MDRRHDGCRSGKMAGLIIKEDMGFQYFKHLPLFDASKEEGIVRHHPPALKRVQCTLVRGRVAGGDQRNTQSIFVGTVGFSFCFRESALIKDERRIAVRCSGFRFFLTLK